MAKYIVVVETMEPKYYIIIGKKRSRKTRGFHMAPAEIYLTDILENATQMNHAKAVRLQRKFLGRTEHKLRIDYAPKS